MLHTRARFLAAGLGLAITSLSPLARAADAPAADGSLPEGTLKAEKPASKGSTELATGAFAPGAKPADDEEDEKNVTDLSVSGGGLFSAGNARTVALTTLARLRLRRDVHELGAAATANFARAGKTGEPIETTVENYQALVRYDYYLTGHVSLFLQNTDRRDRFQGLDLRANIDPGVAYHFFNTKTHRLRIEIGYDLQHDIRRDADLAQPVPDGAPPGTPPPPPLSKTQTLHNARLFAGYENKLRKEVSVILSAEYLQNFSNVEFYRVIANAGLKSSIADNLAVATTYTMRYENRPLPGVQPLDSIGSINLVYTFF